MPGETDNLPAKAEAPLTIRADVLPQRDYISVKITDATPIPAEMFERLGQLQVTPEENAALMAPVPDDEVDIKADGFLYVSHEYCRRRLNEIFGPLGWALVEASAFTRSPFSSRDGNPEYYQKWALFIRGMFVGVTMSSEQLRDNNANTSLDRVYETIQSDCVRRLAGKHCGIGLEVWNKRTQKRWRDTVAIRVLCRVKGETRIQWRRKDSDPFLGWDGKSIEVGEYRDVPESTDGKRPQSPPPQAEVIQKEKSPSSLNPTSAPAAKHPDGEVKPSEKVEVVRDGASEPVGKERNPASAPVANKMKILPAQERMIFARLRNSGLLVGEDGIPAMAWLSDDAGIDLIQDDGKTSAENLAAMIREIPANRVTEIAKKIDAAKGAQ